MIITKHLKRKYARAKRETSFAAMVFDFVLSAFVCFIIAKLILVSLGYSSVSGSFVAFEITAAFTLVKWFIKEKSLKRFIAETRKSIKHELAFCRLVMLGDDEFSKMCLQCVGGEQKNIYTIRTLDTVEANELLTPFTQAAASGSSEILIISTAKVNEAAAAKLSKMSGVSYKLVSGEMLAESYLEKFPVSDDEADSIFEAETKKSVKVSDFWKRFIANRKPSAYLVCAAMLMLTSFFTAFGLYYKLVAILCVWIATFYFVIQKKT